MNTILNGLRALLILGVAIQEAKAEKELDLHFLQDDYQVKFERIELVRYNKDLAKDVSIVTFKCNRTTAVANATFTFKVDVGNDLVVVTQAYKFMSNEYRIFPLRFAANFCKGMAADVGGMNSGSMKCGNFTGCPIVKGRKYHFCNFYPDQSKLPPFVPNGQYKMGMQMLYSSAEILVVNAYVTIFRPIV